MSSLFQTADEPTVIYSAPDGKRLRLTLFRPLNAAQKPRPGVVLIHGGGWMMGTRHQLRDYGRRFARAGFVAISIQYRLMPAHPFPACLHDCKAAVRWLRQHADELALDTGSVAAMGASAGGHLAAMLGVTAERPEFDGNHDHDVDASVQAVVALYAPFDLHALAEYRAPLHLDAVGREFLHRFVQAEAGREQEALLAASPVSHVAPGSPPSLLIHGTDDILVPLSQSQTYYERLKDAGVHAQLSVMMGRGHGFDFFHHDARPAVFDQVLDFLREQRSA